MNIEVLVTKDRDGRHYGRYRWRTGQPWRFTVRYDQRWKVWEDIERTLALENVR